MPLIMSFWDGGVNQKEVDLLLEVCYFDHKLNRRFAMSFENEQVMLVRRIHCRGHFWQQDVHGVYYPSRPEFAGEFLTDGSKIQGRLSDFYGESTIVGNWFGEDRFALLKYYDGHGVGSEFAYHFVRWQSLDPNFNSADVFVGSFTSGEWYDAACGISIIRLSPKGTKQSKPLSLKVTSCGKGLCHDFFNFDTSPAPILGEEELKKVFSRYRTDYIFGEIQSSEVFREKWLGFGGYGLCVKT